MSGRVWIFATLLGIVAVLGLFAYGLAQRGGGGRGGIAINNVGQAGTLNQRDAPDFRLKLSDGRQFLLSEQRGKVVVVNFWASWCPPCRTEAPAIERAWKQSDPQKVVFLGIATWDSQSDVQKFIDTFGLTYTNTRDETGEVVVNYGVTGIPETFVIAPDGRLARHWIGPIDETTLQRFIAEALDAKG